MSLTVQLTDDALRDLDDIHAFFAAADGLARANQLVDGIGAALARLSTPERGEYPKELASLGMRQFRQVHHEPYRMIYQVGHAAVTVLLLIVDGRRDMQALLQRRLLNG